MTKHFRESEFGCKCCNATVPNPHLLVVLELIRQHFKRPIYINSGYRCEKHNAKVGGAKLSQHRLGTAADIVVDNVSPIEVYKYVDSIFPDSYGLAAYETFTHIDVRTSKARW